MLQLVHTASLADEREAALQRSSSIMAGHIAIPRHADSERRLALALDAGQALKLLSGSGGDIRPPGFT